MLAATYNELRLSYSTSYDIKSCAPALRIFITTVASISIGVTWGFGPFIQAFTTSEVFFHKGQPGSGLAMGEEMEFIIIASNAVTSRFVMKVFFPNSLAVHNVPFNQPSSITSHIKFAPLL